MSPPTAAISSHVGSHTRKVSIFTQTVAASGPEVKVGGGPTQ